MKKYRNLIIAGIIIITVLAVSYIYPEMHKVTPMPETKDVTVSDTPAPSPSPTAEPTTEPTSEPAEATANTPVPTSVPTASPTTAPTTEPVYEEEDKELTCIMSVTCHTILNNMDLLDSSKHGIVPADGIIYAPQKISFFEGENVFNVLQRELKRAKIHMEFNSTPIYKSAYIEGINNLYEFDCGELSGWVYFVNGVSPGMGCSRYILKDGDIIEWKYTCDLGKDIGASNFGGQYE